MDDEQDRLAKEKRAFYGADPEERAKMAFDALAYGMCVQRITPQEFYKPARWWQRRVSMTTAAAMVVAGMVAGSVLTSIAAMMMGE